MCFLSVKKVGRKSILSGLQASQRLVRLLCEETTLPAHAHSWTERAFSVGRKVRPWEGMVHGGPWGWGEGEGGLRWTAMGLRGMEDGPAGSPRIPVCPGLTNCRKLDQEKQQAPAFQLCVCVCLSFCMSALVNILSFVCSS